MLFITLKAMIITLTCKLCDFVSKKDFIHIRNQVYLIYIYYN